MKNIVYLYYTKPKAMKLDLIQAKRWFGNNIVRFYFDQKYVTVSTSNNGCGYYKIIGFEEEIVNMDEVISQISYFTNIECNRIFPSKF